MMLTVRRRLRLGVAIAVAASLLASLAGCTSPESTVPSGDATASVRQAHAPIERFLDAMAASLNGPKAAEADLVINLLFSDLGESHVLKIENAVLHHRRGPPDPEADATLTLTKAFFLEMIAGSAGATELLMSDETAIEGSRIDLARFFGLIDKAAGTFPVVTRAEY